MTSFQRANTFFVWAHRGASARAPENTMTAFRAAADAGADGIELDVHLSRDGIPVVIHDDTVDRTTDGTGAVADKSLAELLDLDAGTWFYERFAGERMPLLAEVFAWAGERIRINVEIKDQRAGRAVLSTIADFPEVDVLISSFNHKALSQLRQLNAGLALAFLTDSPFWRLSMRRALACVAESFHPKAMYLTRNLVVACHANNLKIYPWTDGKLLNERDMRRRGVDGYFTDLP
ncbi:MAG: glycerophosphodiester phosphodiesterase [Desulfuromonas sp.]|nr:MAG: glycerophosphodiester phosphodiesterase [Desulfuromonas sp.]